MPQLCRPAGDSSARVLSPQRGLPSPLLTSGSPPLGEAEAEASSSGVRPAAPEPVPNGGLFGARTGPFAGGAFAVVVLFAGGAPFTPALFAAGACAAGACAGARLGVFAWARAGDRGEEDTCAALAARTPKTHIGNASDASTTRLTVARRPPATVRRPRASSRTRARATAARHRPGLPRPVRRGRETGSAPPRTRAGSGAPCGPRGPTQATAT